MRKVIFLDFDGVLHGELDASWRALDDMRFFFSEDGPYLILVDPYCGFDDAAGCALLWNGTLPPPPQGHAQR